jgi:hypothetical protein
MEPSTNVVAGRLRKLSQLSIGFKQAHKRIREVVLSQKMMERFKIQSGAAQVCEVLKVLWLMQKGGTWRVGGRFRCTGLRGVA